VKAFAWSGAAVFVGALAYFLFSYSIRFADVAPGTIEPEPIVWNAALFSVFALHHSVFARQPIRVWVTSVVPPNLERSFYVWIASLLLIGVCALWQPVAGAAWIVEGPGRWALVAAQAAGVWLSIRSAAIIDVWDLAGISRQSAEGSADFKTTGPYGWVRHPIYSGWFLIVFCVGTMTMTRLVFALVSSAYVLIAIPFEERSLRATAGGSYQRYLAQVKWKLVPGIY
jgi:protein-S-isoprenylcysteine O-methyltransferase Ste14